MLYHIDRQYDALPCSQIHGYYGKMMCTAENMHGSSFSSHRLQRFVRSISQRCCNHPCTNTHAPNRNTFHLQSNCVLVWHGYDIIFVFEFHYHNWIFTENHILWRRHWQFSLSLALFLSLSRTNTHAIIFQLCTLSTARNRLVGKTKTNSQQQ